jgi:cyclohexanecarboxylate-CoA ligase
MPIFRERELLFMLGHGEAKLIVVLKDFRSVDYEAMLKGIQPQLPQLQHVVAIGGAGADSFEALLAEPAWERDAEAAQILGCHRTPPDAITQLIYTSGTTGEPKGVMHSSNTLMANIHAYAERLALGRDEVVLMASPMAHQTGFMYGLMMPVMLGAAAVLLDVWNAATAAQLIRQWRCTFLSVRWRAHSRALGGTGADGVGRADHLGMGHVGERRCDHDLAWRWRAARSRDRWPAVARCRGQGSG